MSRAILCPRCGESLKHVCARVPREPKEYLVQLYSANGTRLLERRYTDRDSDGIAIGVQMGAARYDPTSVDIFERAVCARVRTTIAKDGFTVTEPVTCYVRGASGYWIVDPFTNKKA